ncbi:guanylate kinase [Varibaculum vaginae]|uniref:guanylate kinase n=1 Tax=Varibaculum vaginae TaxID=2364797 RepID=UPI000F08B94D|nr:guanylate kinase [Varibaculum vaginae]
MPNSRLFVLAGPSGVGKGTVVNALKKMYPQVKVAVSATTRLPRPGERNGVDYYFLSEERFDELLAANGFLEWAQVHGRARYGTLRSEVAAHFNRGEDVILEIDLAGARQVRHTHPQAHFIFLLPPSQQALEARLRGRGTEGEAEVARRLETAKTEMAAAKEFEYQIVNNQPEQAARELAALMGIA